MVTSASPKFNFTPFFSQLSQLFDGPECSGMFHVPGFIDALKKNVNHSNFLSENSNKTKPKILTIKIGVIFLDKNLFFLAKLNRLLYFWVFK